MIRKTSELVRRIYTAVPLVAFAIVAVFYLDWVSFLLCNTVLMCLLGWEWVHLFNYTLAMRFTYLFALLLGCGVTACAPTEWVLGLALLMGVLLLAYLALIVYRKRTFRQSSRLLSTVGGMYLVLNWHALFLLRGVPTYLALGLLIVVLTDTLAYLVGKYWGTHVLSVVVSHHKTWEGFFAGLIGPSLLVLLVNQVSADPLHMNSQKVGLMLFTALMAIAGDLSESAVKRQCGTKDSGHSLPGHGGWLDRFDSLVCAMPVFAASLFYLVKFA